MNVSMNAPQFGSVHHSQVQKGAVFTKQEFTGKNTQEVLVVTSEPGRMSKVTVGAPLDERFPDLGIFPLHYVRLPFEADQYTAQKDGSFKKTGEVSNPFVFSAGKDDIVALQSGYNIVNPDKVRQEGKKLWIDA